LYLFVGTSDTHLFEVNTANSHLHSWVCAGGAFERTHAGGVKALGHGIVALMQIQLVTRVLTVTGKVFSYGGAALH